MARAGSELLDLVDQRVDPAALGRRPGACLGAGPMPVHARSGVGRQASGHRALIARVGERCSPGRQIQAEISLRHGFGRK